MNETTAPMYEIEVDSSNPHENILSAIFYAQDNNQKDMGDYLQEQALIMFSIIEEVIKLGGSVFPEIADKNTEQAFDYLIKNAGHNLNPHPLMRQIHTIDALKYMVSTDNNQVLS